MSSSEKILLLFILEKTDKEGKVFSLTNTEISKIFNKNKGTISGSLSRLEDKGYVEILYSLDFKEIDGRCILSTELTNEEKDELLQKDEKEYYTSEDLKTIREKRSKEFQGKKTDVGFIYLIKSKYGYKIGKSKKIQDRLSLFNVKLPFKIDVIGYYKVESMSEMETFLHKKYKNLRLEGEWFNLKEKEKKEVLTILIENQM